MDDDDDDVGGAREAGREGRDLATAMARPRVREEAGGVLNPKGEPELDSLSAVGGFDEAPLRRLSDLFNRGCVPAVEFSHFFCKGGLAN